MSQPLPERADMRQLRNQAKDLLRSLQSGETPADDLVTGEPKLADAQRMVARKFGFDSWPQLVNQVELPILLKQAHNAVQSGDFEGLEKLFKTKPVLRKHINDPMFSFDSPAIVSVSGHPMASKLVPILVRNGADPNARSKWWAGGFSALDFAKGETVDLLLRLGAKFDVWSASAQGRLEVLKGLLDENPELVNAPGGDGQRPLHVAANAEVAELLIQQGADLEIKDIDHEATPLQYQVGKPDVMRTLLAHGAKPDVFTAAVLNDPAILQQVLRESPDALNARTGEGDFSTHTSNGGHIYIFVLGPSKTPQQVAVEKGSTAVLDEMLQNASPARRLVAAAWTDDAKAVAEILKDHPNVSKEMGEDARAITEAAQNGKIETVRLLLEAGLDPMTPGMDSGTALHVACWFGHLGVVEILKDKVPLETRDAHHGSTPLGWAAHGAQWCRNKVGDYVGVATTLLNAGADPLAPANGDGTPLLEQAGDREDVKAVLRTHGAK